MSLKSAGKEIVSSFFRLKEDKKMGDGSTIFSDVLLRKISKEKNMINVETVEKNNVKKIFWVEENEINFIHEEKEFFTFDQLLELKKEREGKWL